MVSRWRLGYAVLVIAGAVAAAVAGVIGGSAGHDGVLWLACIVVGLICALMLFYVLRASWLEGDPFQPAVGFLLVAFLGYGVGALHAQYGVVSAHGPIDPVPGLLMGLIAIIMFSLGYALPVGRTLDSQALEHWWSSWNPQRAFLAGLLCFAIGAIASGYYFENGEYFAYTTNQLLEEQSSTIGYFRELLFVGLTIASVAAYGPGGTAAMRRIVVSLALAALITLLPTGIRYYLLFTAAAVLLPRHYYYRKFRLASILLAIALIVGLVYPVGELYRRQYQANPSGSVADAASRVVDQLSQLGPGQYLDFAFGPAAGRIDLATPASALQAVVPDTISYKWGASFFPIFIFWVPRLVWPDKPTFQYDNELGRAEGLIAPADFRTSVKYSYVGELYLDFGWAGIVVGMALYGLLFRLFYQVAVRRRHPIGIMVYSLTLVLMWTIETPIGPALAGVIRDVISALIVLWLCGAFQPVLVLGPGGQRGPGLYARAH